jgi:putative endonuclease
MNKKEFGKKGENLAINFLKKKQYTILENNFQKRSGEIDIIAKDFNGEIVFIEVKIRQGHNFGYPEEAVDTKKIKKIMTTGIQWLFKSHMQTDFFRIDIIGIEIIDGKPDIVHIENVSF